MNKLYTSTVMLYAMQESTTLSFQGDAGEVLRSPHLAVLPWPVVLYGFVSCNKDWVSLLNMGLTYGKVAWDPDPTERRWEAGK